MLKDYEEKSNEQIIEGEVIEDNGQYLKEDQLKVKDAPASNKGDSVSQENSELPSSDFPDLSKLRLSQNFSETAGVKKALLMIPVRKPNRQEFVRIHPDEDMSLQTAVLQLKEERETYLVDPTLCSELPGEIIPMVLFTTINRQGVLTLWPIRLPGDDGRHNQWHISALKTANMAKTQWLRLSANMSLGGYDVFVATANFPEPEWPDYTFQQIMEIAFKEHFIQEIDHPVLRRLRGEI